MKFGVIFDMDGTLVDNMRYHMEATALFFKKHGVEMTMDEFLQRFNGKTNNDIFRAIFGQDIAQEKVDAYSDEKEALYRKLYAPHLRFAEGLESIIRQLYADGVPMAVGSSACDQNIDFVLNGLDARKYFKAVVNSSQITKGKPDPEVFLKAAAAIGMKPECCVVCEDALAGIAAGRAAGARVVAVASVMPREELQHADLVVDSFSELSVSKIVQLLQK
ncbi:MAG: beta-phosphoglucomutase family hydrolase [Prevotellaceae bacterium]|jgi:beta-phosphoglucomutase family hydrolase|nr:beta-phosphoglucomutase family hydrolase [Prevotellaceae bacterium]